MTGSIAVPARMRRRHRGAALAILAVTMVAACGSRIAVPPDSAPPDVVLNAYLAALLAGDCPTAQALAASTFTVAGEERCGTLHVSAFTALTGPATPRDGEAVFSTILTISGDDVPMNNGEHVRFYDLRRQPNGAWRVAGGGTGP